MRRGDGRDVIAAIVRAYIMFVEGAGESSALLFESDVTHDADVRARVEHASSEAARRITAVLSQVTALSLEDAGMLAVSLIAMAQGAATHRLRQPDDVGPERTVELVTQLAWGGVSGADPARLRVRGRLGSDDVPRPTGWSRTGAREPRVE